MGVGLFLNGLTNGANIALLAVAFFLAFSFAKTFHIALGAIYTLAPFVFIQAQKHGAPWYTAAVVAVLVTGCSSFLCDFANHRNLRNRGASPEAHLLSSIGIYIVLVQVVLIVWGPDARLVRTGIEPEYLLGAIVVRRSQVASVVALAVVVVPILWMLTQTKVGLKLREMRDNPTELELLGISAVPIRLLLFTLAGILAGIASLIDALDGGFQAHYGFPALLLAVVAALSVNASSRWAIGAVALAAIGLGLIRALVVWNLGSRWQDTFSYALFALALAWHGRRPERVP